MEHQPASESAHRHQDWFVPIIAMIVTIGFFGVIGLIACAKVDAANHDSLNVLCGVLGTAWIQVISFYFGATYQKMENKK